MSDSNAAASSGGIGFFGLLTILFIALKLMHYIDWSWLWVLSPLWVPASFVVLVFLIIILGAFLISTISFVWHWLYNKIYG